MTNYKESQFSKYQKIDNKTERGLLGIAALKENTDKNLKVIDKIQDNFSSIHNINYNYAETLA
jgi:hypothetical protein